MFNKRWALFDAEGGAGGTDTNDGTTTGGTGDDKATGGTGDDKGKDTVKKIELTEAQLAERLARARRTEQAELLKTLGFEKAEDLKKAIEDKKKADEDKKTEAQKLREEHEATKKRLAELEDHNKTLTFRTKLRDAASEAGLSPQFIRFAEVDIQEWVKTCIQDGTLASGDQPKFSDYFDHLKTSMPIAFGQQTSTSDTKKKGSGVSDTKVEGTTTKGSTETDPNKVRDAIKGMSRADFDRALKERLHNLT